MSDLNFAPIGSFTGPTQIKTAKTPEVEEKESFGHWLSSSLAQVNAMEQASNSAAEKLITGENKDIHGTMIAMQKSSIAMELIMQVRNKVIAAYDEIKRMQF